MPFGKHPPFVFDRRKQLESLPVLLQVDRGADLEAEAARKNVASRAGLMLNDVVQAHLLGVGDEVRDLLEKCNLWLEHGTSAWDLRSLALCRWLRDADPQTELFRRACEAWRGDTHPSEMDWHMGYAAQCDYEPALNQYESAPKCSRHVTPAKLSAPRSLGYLLLRHSRRGEYSAKEMEQACARLLASHIPLWLRHGGYLETAMWLKIAYSDRGPRLAPRQSLERAFDFVTRA